MKKDTKELIIFIVICIGIILAVAIPSIIERNKINKTFEGIGNGAKEFQERIENSESYIDDFVYNNETGEVEYHPKD